MSATGGYLISGDFWDWKPLEFPTVSASFVYTWSEEVRAWLRDVRLEHKQTEIEQAEIELIAATLARVRHGRTDLG